MKIDVSLELINLVKHVSGQKKALFACFYKANDIKVTSIYKAYHDKIHMQNSFYAFTITLQTCVWVQLG
jgi:hypothetical protein